jgi:hypothetical protein
MQRHALRWIVQVVTIGIVASGCMDVTTVYDVPDEPWPSEGVDDAASPDADASDDGATDAMPALTDASSDAIGN